MINSSGNVKERLTGPYRGGEARPKAKASFHPAPCPAWAECEGPGRGSMPSAASKGRK